MRMPSINFPRVIVTSLPTGLILSAATQAMSQQPSTPVGTAAIERATDAKGTSTPRRPSSWYRCLGRTCRWCRRYDSDANVLKALRNASN